MSNLDTMKFIYLFIFTPLCIKLKSNTSSPQSCAINLLFMMFLGFFFCSLKKICCCGFFLRSSRERSSHTHETERSLSQEGWRDDRPEFRDWEDREKSPSVDRTKGRDRERSLSYERDRRSSSEERESGEIWTGGDASKVFDLDILFSKRNMERCMLAGASVWVSFVCAFMYISRGGWWGNNFIGGGQGNMQTNFYRTLHCEASVTWNQISLFFMPSFQSYVKLLILIYFDSDKGWVSKETAALL